jgi:thioredoxin reductase (NADPH)
MQEQVAVEKTPLLPENGEDFDLIVIGAGPAGMAAAVGAGRARLKTLVIDKALPGGKAATS